MGASTVRTATATDFKTVSLPALTRSGLTDSVTAGRTPAPAGTFTVDTQTAPMSFDYPLDPTLLRWVRVTNTSRSFEALGFHATISGPDGFFIDGDALGVFPHPQPNNLYLEPGESQDIWVTANWEELDNQGWQAGKTYDYVISVKVFPRMLFPGEREPPGTNTVLLANSIHVTQFGPTDPPANAAISGCVYDAATKQAVPNAGVFLTDHWSGFPRSGQANSEGSYSLPVPAHLVAPAGVWQPWTLAVSAPGYREATVTMGPHEGDAEVANVALDRATERAAYTLSAKIDTGGLNVNRGVISKDGRYLALTQFHTDLPPGQDPGTLAQSSVLFFDTTAQRLLWRFPLGGESPAVAMADDGSLVATARPAGHVFVLDRAGEVVWDVGSKIQRPVYEVRFSHSGRYLAAGDIAGNLYLLDLRLRTVVWQRFLRGQVRALEFDQDDRTLYAGAGDGYVYAFDIAGHVSWRAYVGGWPISFAMSRDYLFTSGKEGYFVSLLNKDGAVLWQYPVRAAAHLESIAPDETFFLAQGNANNFGTMIFSPDGVLEYRLANSEPGAISADSSHVVLSGEIFGPPGSNPQHSIWVELIDRTGNVVWRQDDVGTTAVGGTGGFAWISDDERRIVVTSGEWVFFFDGSVTRH
jgi:hypothetical protein